MGMEPPMLGTEGRERRHPPAPLHAAGRSAPALGVPPWLGPPYPTPESRRQKRKVP